MKRIFLLFSMFASAGLYAQGDYQLTFFSAACTEISGAEVYDDPEWDDPEIDIALGFPFSFGTNDIVNLIQIGFGAEWASITVDGADLITYGADIISSAGAEDPGEPSIISWVTEGEPGNRILKIQYKDVAFWAEITFQGTAENRANFQIWLYEQGSAIEFRFGPSNIVDANIAYEGLGGSPIYFAAGIDEMTGEVDFGGLIGGNPSTPQLFGFDNLFDFFDGLIGSNMLLAGTPADGQVYRLSTESVSTRELPAHSFELYPTLAQQELFLRGDLTPGMAYRIVSRTGAAVANGVLAANRIDVSALDAGM